MRKLSRICLLATTFAVVVALGGGTPAMAQGGGAAQGGGTYGSWPVAFPLPISPGTVESQTSTTAVARSTDTVAAVTSKLDDL